MCGEDVPRTAVACPNCGAEERSGWRRDVGLYGEDPALDSFDYDDFVEGEFGSRAKPQGLSTFWWIAAIVVLVAVLLLFARQGGF